MSTSEAKPISLNNPSAQLKMHSYTFEQLNTLLDYFEKNRELARGRDRLRASEKWKDIKNKLNSLSTVSQKSTKQWQKIWADKKYLARKALVIHSKNGPPLSSLEIRILSILGELKQDTRSDAPIEKAVVQNVKPQEERSQNEIVFNVDVGIKREVEEEEGEVLPDRLLQVPEGGGMQVVEQKVKIKKEKLRDEENQLNDPLNLEPQYLEFEIQNQNAQYSAPPPSKPVSYMWSAFPVASSSAPLRSPRPANPPITDPKSQTRMYRVPGPSPRQLHVLLKFFEENRDVAVGSLNSSIEERCKLRNKWTEIIKKLNRMGGCKKTRKQWQKYWADRKYIARKEYQRLKSDPASIQSLLSNDGDHTNERYNARIMVILGLVERPDGTKGHSNVAVVKGVQNKSSHLLQLLTEQSRGKVSDERIVEENSNGGGINVERDMQCEEGDSDRNGTRDRSNVESRLSEPNALDLDHNYEQPTLKRKDAGLQRVHRRPPRGFSERLFRIEERREESDRRRNEELSGIRTSVGDLCKLVRQLIECHYDK